jgi:arylsulfatase A-like enzyme
VTAFRHPWPRSLRNGVLAGTLAGAGAGALDALWGWRSARQFVPGILSRLRFVLGSAAENALAGAAVGLIVTVALLILLRGSRLGDMLRFGWDQHVEKREQDPRTVVAGLALVITLLPLIGIALAIAFRISGKVIAGRKAAELMIAVPMVATLAALAVAVPVGFVIARVVEDWIARLVGVTKLRALSSPFAPPVAAAGLIGVGLAAWAARNWETARVLPLRGPVVVALGFALVPVVWKLARHAEVLIQLFRPAIRRAVWIAYAPLLFVIVVILGGAPVTKATAAYTGLGGPIARGLRAGFDWDHDGYARILGGGDCDDGDASVHPGAQEIPDDGIDQNCVGGDPTTTPAPNDTAFVLVPPDVVPNANVLLITIDTLRADHLGTYGYARKTSPNIDAIAKDGTVFTAGWAHAPSTRYSMPAILTGRLPLDVYYDYSHDWWPGLLPEATTIAELLQPLGFATGAITNYVYFDKSRRMDQGFAEYDNQNAARHMGVSGSGPEQTRGSSSQQQTDKAIEFVTRHQAQKWMLWVHYYDPHYAYEGHAEVPFFGGDRMALYDGEIAYTDLHIGRLIDDLKKKGLYDKTIIVITGDHGEGFGEHGVDMHGYHLYSAQTKVPMIMRVPKLPSQRSDVPAGHIDIMPTLVNLAGGKPTPDMMGRSLVDILAGNPPTDAEKKKIVFQQLSYEGNHEMRAGVTKQCHVIYNVSPDPGWEVYRVDKDPMEEHDLEGDDDACADTRRAVERWFDASQVPAGSAEALLPTRPAIANPLDADLGEGVRLLGVEAPQVAHRGQPITLTWTFAATGKVPPGWKMFVHVEGPGHLMVNGDHSPTRPFAWWRAGQFIRYTTTIGLPPNAPDGAYTIWAGLFKGKDRAPVHAPTAKVDNNAVAVATLQVTQ